MKISDLFKQKTPVLGFEIFPPKPEVPVESIYESLAKFIDLKPDYISVTFGAGGSQKGKTVEIASKIKNEYNVESMAHFTCVGHSKDDIDRILDNLRNNNIHNILALRGDYPEDSCSGNITTGSFSYANELVSYIKSRNEFCIGAAAYLEGHIESKTIKDDLDYLKQKVDSGVDFLLTQLFFDNRLYYDFLDKTHNIGIECPIVPGIMPIFKAEQIKAITAKSGCSIPAKLVVMMDKYSDNPDDLRKAGIEYASKQIRDLVSNGAPGIHLYTMNRPKSTRDILMQSDLRV